MMKWLLCNIHPRIKVKSSTRSLFVYVIKKKKGKHVVDINRGA